ncbi:DNA methyltransferase [Desulfosporosinus sp. Tol-M]|nr:DNA methyltransferase [Desulfosporosinus sp. Tol-M]
MSDKMKFETPNLTAENVAKIAELFPGVVTEGNVNIDLLRAMLGEDVFTDEAYEFTWVGKRAAIAEAGRPIRKTLRPVIKDETIPTGTDSTGKPYCSSGSRDWDTTENLYIEGDNLDVLKLLQESYLGKVKMVYIDPPYNTGNDFVYRDNFTASREDYEEETGVYEEDGDRLFKNTETNGRFHSDWCSMIYPRLVLARNLLTTDGVIFISIDDGEVAQLRKISDEVFGESNFLACFCWKRKKEISSDSKNVAVQGEYILCYSKSSFADLKLEPISEEYVAKSYNAPTPDFPDGKWRPVPLTVSKGLSGGGYTYTITTPSGAKHKRLWAYPEKSYEQLLSNGRVYFGKDKSGVPQRVIYAHESKGQPITNYWDAVSSNKEGKKTILELFGNASFDTAKPIELVLKMMRVATDPGDIILDFFSGSATTAHAVMQLNAEDSGKRKFVMVQLPEVCGDGTEAAKAGYATICEIGKERIRRAGDKIKGEAGLTAKGLDIGFRVLKLDDTNMNEVYYAAGDYTQDMILMMQSNIKEDRSDMDLLYSCLLDWGLPLSMPHTHEKIEGYSVHTYNDGDLIACFEDRISEKAVREIASRQPLRAVFRDSSFTSSPEKINVFEIFKLLAPNTTVRVI